MKLLTLIGLVAGSLLLMLGLAWIIEGNNFFLYKVFAPREEQVRREVFEQSKSYNDGMLQELYSMQLDYVKAKNAEQKAAIKSVILHRVSGYDQNKLPFDLRQFINQLKSED